jgi:hypothetical protein
MYRIMRSVLQSVSLLCSVIYIWADAHHVRDYQSQKFGDVESAVVAWIWIHLP